MSSNKYSFTLIELVIVTIIIGIVATFAVPGYFSARERALDREAQAMLEAIQAAEKVIMLETQSYYPLAGSVNVIANINTNLRLDIQNSGNWTYEVWSTGCSEATRTTDARVWSFKVNDADGVPDSGAACP